jgi:hypothetical protein
MLWNIIQIHVSVYFHGKNKYKIKVLFKNQNYITSTNINGTFHDILRMKVSHNKKIKKHHLLGKKKL